MNSTVYDRVVCDPWWGNSPHENLLPKGFKKRPMILSFVREPYPFYTENKFEEYLRDNFLMKTLHLLAQDYEHYVYFSYVNMATDEDLIGATLGIDILNRVMRPVTVMIHENQVFLIPYEVQSYSDFVEYIEGGYKENKILILPLARRTGTLGYVCKLVFRKIIDVFKVYQGDVRNLFTFKQMIYSGNEEDSRTRLLYKPSEEDEVIVENTYTQSLNEEAAIFQVETKESLIESMLKNYLQN